MNIKEVAKNQQETVILGAAALGGTRKLMAELEIPSQWPLQYITET